MCPAEAEVRQGFQRGRGGRRLRELECDECCPCDGAQPLAAADRCCLCIRQKVLTFLPTRSQGTLPRTTTIRRQ